jgi:hypothetical protein
MKVGVRRPAIIFAVLSAIFWVVVSDLAVSIGGVDRDVYHRPPSHVETWLVSGLPAIVYAVACVFFCHWLARRVVRQMVEQKGE